MLITVEAKNILIAWKKSLMGVYNYGIPMTDLARNAVLSLKIDNVADSEVEDNFSRFFPMSLTDIEVINDYFVFGRYEDQVVHDWTKIYRQRLVNDKINQIKAIIDYLKQNPNGKRAQASIWQQSIDLKAEIAPCLQVLWFQIIEEKLDLHVHMRASDAYGKLLMNIHEFAAMQRYVANQLGLKTGQFYQFIDTCHINQADLKKVEQMLVDPSW